ncbi:synaptophysin-like isoform X2 [Homalodisca vitripennis]|uniref:synaptophysin-like isoform X2 n=1 Tax=Homalodisca vitripennis TaxID=197043 RepID=UPI001EECC650|nr:synaptophysin-like isoform X2 [Homalodisca vitripennis]
MSTFTNVRELGGSLQKYNLEVFKEPRGIIRILQFVFALITAIVLKTYEGYIEINYCSKTNPKNVRLDFEYPFNLNIVSAKVECNGTSPIVSLGNDFSSEAEFLFTMCWVSVIYVIIMAFIYIKFREDYESNGNLALVDFGASVVLAVLWIACLGAWGYGQSQLKSLTHPDYLRANLHGCSPGPEYINCITITRGNVVGLTESLILSFLNFFLWAAGLWFLYKETPWYLQFQRA